MNVHHKPEKTAEKAKKQKQPPQTQEHQPGVESRMRPRPDERHVPKHDVEELWQLVDAGGAKDAADARHARIVDRRLDRAGVALGIDDHRAELEGGEDAAVLADTLLDEQYRPAILDLDRRGNDRRDRRKHQQSCARDQDVEEPLDHPATSSMTCACAATWRSRANNSDATRARVPIAARSCD